jgi:hypothetical protein
MYFKVHCQPFKTRLWGSRIFHANYINTHFAKKRTQKTKYQNLFSTRNPVKIGNIFSCPSPTHHPSIHSFLHPSIHPFIHSSIHLSIHSSWCTLCGYEKKKKNNENEVRFFLEKKLKFQPKIFIELFPEN